MKIHFPNSAFLGNMDQFLQLYSPIDDDVLEVTFHDSWISAHPFVLCMTAALGSLMHQQGKIIRCGVPLAKSKLYLARMKLFEYLDSSVSFPLHEHEPSGRFIPITNIRTGEQLTNFISDLVPLLHTTPNQADAVKYTISELVRNVLEHAKSPVGALVCAQYFKKSNKVSIGVADCGLGIKTTIGAVHQVKTDGEAIKLALIPGVTGTTAKPGGTEANAGAGLFFVKSIAKVNRNFFMLYSGSGAYKLLKSAKNKISLYADPNRDKHSYRDDFPYWQGTVVGVDISMSGGQTFEALLSLIREVYSLDVKERKKLKKARFL